MTMENDTPTPTPNTQRPAPVAPPPAPSTTHNPLGTAILAFVEGDALLLATMLAIFIVGEIMTSVDIFDLTSMAMLYLSCLIAPLVTFALLVPVARKILQPRFGNNRKLTMAAILISASRLPILWMLYNLTKGIDGWCEGMGGTLLENIMPIKATSNLHDSLLSLCFAAGYVAVTVAAIRQVKRMAETGTHIANGTAPAPTYVTPWEQTTCGGIIWDPRTEAWALATTIASTAGLILSLTPISSSLSSSSSMTSILEDPTAWGTAWFSPEIDRNLLAMGLIVFVPALVAGAISLWRAKTTRPGLAYMSTAAATCCGIVAGSLSHMSAGVLLLSLAALVPLAVTILSDRGMGWDRSALTLALLPVGAVLVACVLPSSVPLMTGAVLSTMMKRYATVRCNEATFDAMAVPVTSPVPTAPFPPRQISSQPMPMRDGTTAPAPHPMASNRTDATAGYATSEGLNDIMVMTERTS